MAKKTKVRFLCTYCEAKISEGVAFCAACGHPTSWATHDQKVAWELEQYEQRKGQLVEGIKSASVPVIPRASARRSGTRQPGEAIAPVRAKGERVAHAAPRRPARPVRLPVAQPIELELPDADDQALLFKIVRVLNQRIAELEMRVAELEGSESQVVG